MNVNFSHIKHFDLVPITAIKKKVRTGTCSCSLYKVHIVLVLYIAMIQLISDVPYYWRSSMKWIFLNIDKLDYSLIIYTVEWELTY